MAESLDEVLAAARAHPERAVFISRTGVEVQRQLAGWIAHTLKQEGFIPILQDAHFQHVDFLMAMNDALETGARVLAVLSREYLGSQYCKKEWTCALSGDPGNAKGRLIVLNVDGCSPTGLLSNVAYVRFQEAWKSGHVAEMRRVLLGALRDPAHLGGTYFVPPAVDAAQRLHPEILNHDENAFTGREDDLRRLHDTLWTGETGTAALPRRSRGATG